MELNIKTNPPQQISGDLNTVIENMKNHLIKNLSNDNTKTITITFITSYLNF